MCEPFQFTVPNCSRRTFLRRCVVASLGAAVLPAIALADTARKIQWARLRTPGRNWNIHGDQDDVIAEFIALNTGIRIEPKATTVGPEAVDPLCAFPLLFTNDVAPLVDPVHRANLREYLRRGGFVFVDACIDPRVTPSFPDYFRANLEFFLRLFPGAQVRMLKENHAIFRSYFAIEEADTRTGRGERGHWGNVSAALYGIYDGDDMIALLSLDRLRCGWPNDPERMTACVKLITNIYVYAMTR